MSLEDKVETHSKILTPVNLQRLNALRYKALHLDSQLGHAQRNMQDAKRAAEEALNKFESHAQAIGFELGVDIAGWDEETGVIFERPAQVTDAAPQNVG